MDPKLLRAEGPSENWPVNGTEHFPFTDVGMATMILSIPYSMGYVSVAEAIDWGLQVHCQEGGWGGGASPQTFPEGSASRPPLGAPARGSGAFILDRRLFFRKEILHSVHDFL